MQAQKFVAGMNQSIMERNASELYILQIRANKKSNILRYSISRYENYI